MLGTCVLTSQAWCPRCMHITAAWSQSYALLHYCCLCLNLTGDLYADLVSSALIFSGICTFLHVLGFRFGNTRYQWGTGERFNLAAASFPHCCPRKSRKVQTALLAHSSRGEPAH